MPDATTMEKPLLDPVALAHEIAKEAVRQTAYAPRWVSLKQASIEEFDANAGTRRH